MINLLFFNPLNLFPIVHLVRRDPLGLTESTSVYHNLTSVKKGRISRQLAVMTSKCFCHRPLLTISHSIRWPSPPQEQGVRAAETRAKIHLINGTFLWAWDPWAGSKNRRIVVWGTGRKLLDYDLPANPPPWARQKARPPDRCGGKTVCSSWHFCWNLFEPLLHIMCHLSWQNHR